MTVDKMLGYVPEKGFPLNTQELIQIYGKNNLAFRKYLKDGLYQQVVQILDLNCITII